MIGLKIKAIIGIVLAGGLFFGGWQVRSYYEDSQDLAAKEERDKIMQAVESRESNLALDVQKQIRDLDINTRTIDRGIIREVEKPVYRNVCLPANGVRLFNAIANGEAISRESIESMSNDTAKPDESGSSD